MGKKKSSGKTPSHFSLHKEQGEITSKRQGKITVALVYPNTYQAGMSNLGFQSVYALFNVHAHVACHRFFLPAQRRERRGKFAHSSHPPKRTHGYNKHRPQPTPIEASGSPRKSRLIGSSPSGETLPRSVETGMPLSHYDIIAFSISFENDYINLLSILKSAPLPPRAADRNDTHPLIIAGGVAAFLNPEPVAPFIDCFLIGEVEHLISRFIEIYSDGQELARNQGRFIDKQSLLRSFATTMKGVYIPSFYAFPIHSKSNGSKENESEYPGPLSPIYPDIPKTIEVQRVSDLGKIVTTTRILTPDTVFDNTFLIETGRGCPHGCRFCSAGFIYRPARFYPDHVVIKAMDKALGDTDKIGLVSPAVSDHPQINAICLAGIANDQKISFSSLRLDNLTDETINTLVKASVKTTTIAPEAGSERMRRIINKKITEDQILSAVKRIVAHGILNIKLYFMTGLPFETDEDVDAIVTLTLKIKEQFLEESRKNKKIGTITLSINPFVPKPATPFQWAAMDKPAAYKKKVKRIREGLKKEGNVVVNSESPKVAQINALLARGDRCMADVLESAADVGWPQTLKDPTYSSNLPPIYHPMNPHAPLPWDILDTGIKKSFLINEFQRAKNEKVTQDCPLEQCNRCGICLQ